MNKQPSDNFDDIIRQKLEAEETEFHEASWDKMEELLDKKKRRKFFYWPWLLSGTILLISTAILFYAKGKLDEAEKTNALVKAIFKEQKNNSLNEKSAETANLNHLKEDNSAKIEPSLTQRPVKAITDKLSSPIYLNKPLLKTKSFTNDAELNSTAKNINTITPESTLSANSNKATSTSVASSSHLSIFKNNNEDQVIQTHTTEIADELKNNTTIPVIAEKTNANTSTEKKLPVISQHKFPPSFFLSAAYGAGFTFIPGSSGKFSTEFSIGTGWQIGNHWAITADLIKTHKKYNAQKKDYKLEPGSYFAGRPVNNIAADCNVTELALGVRYNFKPSGKQLFFLTAGVASIQMNNEDYDYDYINLAGVRANHTVSYKSNHWFWLSAGYLGAGYQRNINNQLALTANTYYQFPLDGVGDGKMKIYSIGTKVGLIYAPSFKKKGRNKN